MIKENQKIFNGIYIVIDMITVVVSFLMAYYIKFNLLNSISSMDFYDFFIPVLLSVPIYFIIYSLFGIYEFKRNKSFYKESIHVLYSNIIVFLIFVLFLFVFKLVNFSRVVLLLFFIINTLATILLKYILRKNLVRYRKLGFNQKNCIILGTTNLAKKLIDNIEKNKQWGYNIDSLLDNNKVGMFYGHNIDGKLEKLEEVLNSKCIDVVFIALNQEDFNSIENIISICEKSGVKSRIVPYYQEYITSRPYIDDFDGVAVLDTRYVPLDNKLYSFMKRSFDIAFALFAIFLTLPVMIFSAIMIKITSPGPIIYKQERVGLNRKNFYMYKFRSMKVQKEEEEKTKWTTKDDPRKTKWGSFMRKTSIDELPQFFNVLKGDMSIVGPRPERPFFVEKFKEEIPKYMIKHQVRPGITGWAQISGYRGDTSIEGRIKYDLYYIENWNFIFDLKIIFLTIFKGFVNKNAY